MKVSIKRDENPEEAARNKGEMFNVVHGYYTFDGHELDDIVSVRILGDELGKPWKVEIIAFITELEGFE
jgi:hypothetical protein